MHLLVATSNPHKTAEFARILGSRFAISDLRSLSSAAEVEETGASFEENATLKAFAASERTQALVVADDSGLEVDALRGAPGVRSARYAGPNATDEANVAKLLGELSRARDSSRNARFRCALVLAQRGIIIQTFAAEVRGTVSREARGDAGFGYDPIFVPEGFQQTFAEIGSALKDKMSHRGRAIAFLQKHLNGEPSQR
ncbi:MAG: RdgB/HAM1 family non-canonical purine NTP pyrophosphatase [Chthoniobacterales bacterium]|nr:RdgB/HAM1 family non-canonical purine NTP pyrophosphatase [Chthoniobacterales bacterium]